MYFTKNKMNGGLGPQVENMRDKNSGVDDPENGNLAET